MLLVSVNALLAAAPLLAPCLGRDGAALAAALLGLGGAAALRPRRGATRGPGTRIDGGAGRWGGRLRRAARYLGGGLLAGMAVGPALAALAHGAAGLLPNAGPATPAIRAEPAGMAGLALALVVGPLLEEILYRQRVLPELSERLGWPLGAAATTGLFAASHPEPHLGIGAALLGAGLAALWRHRPILPLAWGVHAGVNLEAAALAGSLPAPGAVLSGVAVVAMALACVARRHGPATGPGPARLVRPAAALLSLGAVLAARLLGEDGSGDALLLGAVLALGYGHLLAAARLPRPTEAARWLRLGVWLPPSLLVYAAALGRWPALSAGLVALSVWHAAENDAALARSGGRGGLRLPWLPPGPARLCAASAAWTGAALAAAAAAALDSGWWAAPGLPAWLPFALAAPGALFALGALLREPERPRVAAALLLAAVAAPVAGLHLSPVEVFAAPALHHLLSFLLLAGARLRSAETAPAERRALAWRLGATHAVPLVAGGALLLGAPGAGSRGAELMLSPGLYLFWSTLHVAQTWWSRRPHTARHAPRGGAAGRAAPDPGGGRRAAGARRPGAPRRTQTTGGVSVCGSW